MLILIYDHNRFMYRMNKFRIRVRSLENCPIYLTRALSWFNSRRHIFSGIFLTFQSRSDFLEKTTIIANPRVYFTPVTEFIAW
jgi:hypothetical protein